MDSQASKRRLLAAERRTRALELRKAGRTFREIGQELGCSEQRAHKVVSFELQRLNSKRSETALAVRQLELTRLDALIAGIWSAAIGGDGPAIDRVLSIMARRAKLCGLDAPQKRELSGKDGRPSNVQISELTDEDLARLAGSSSEGASASADSPPTA